ncbi:unnamed protein product [Parnassius apollo]|uniref:(apollo) hypothetical protein n=1 Tax=Parnassius apollo TaxID=110799 RepID=A0A8S3XBL9_PARAO|nr:unnamed protein product [Parnassius apollo]
MVVQNSQDRPSVILPNTNLESKKYIVVKNHVRELTSRVQDESSGQKSKASYADITQQKGVIKKNKRKLSNCTESAEKINTCEINKSDLDELKAVYSQCKSVLKSIESKYGHLLNLINETQGIHSGSESFESEVECECSQNKKIVFDDEGKQIVKDTEFEKHICLKKLKCKQSKLPKENSNVEIEYESEKSLDLPDSLNELGNLLKEPFINNQLRRTIINKIRGIRQVYINELKFDKQALVEKLKTNSEEILEFKGTNLSTLAGYPA